MYRRVQKKKKATNCCIRFWSLVMVRNQLPTQVVNILRWNDVPRTSWIFCPKIAIFSQFSVYLSKTGKTNNKFITYQQFLSSDIIPTSSKEKESDELLYMVLVARYGPQSIANASGQSVSFSLFSIAFNSRWLPRFARLSRLVRKYLISIAVK